MREVPRLYTIFNHLDLASLSLLCWATQHSHTAGLQLWARLDGCLHTQTSCHPCRNVHRPIAQRVSSCSLHPPASAMRLCPQACPMPGRASYSHRTATLAPPARLSPHVALKAVGRVNSLSTRNPLSSRNRVRSACACFSWKPSSGWLHISELSSASAAEFLSIAATARLLVSETSITMNFDLWHETRRIRKYTEKAVSIRLWSFAFVWALRGRKR